MNTFRRSFFNTVWFDLLVVAVVAAVLWVVIDFSAQGQAVDLTPPAGLPVAEAAEPPGEPLKPLPEMPAYVALLTTAVIAGLRRLFPRAPKWLWPVAAPFIGGVLTAAAASLELTQAGWLVGLLSGGAGVGLRESFHQLRKSAAAPPVALLALFLVPLLFLTPGCAGFANRQEDRSLVIHPDGTREERTITSRQEARTLFDSKSALARLKATQTDKTQSLGIGALEQESATPNVAGAVGLEQILKFLGTPEGRALARLFVPVP